MKINSVKGTNDFLPDEASLRDYLQKKIIETYKNYGFTRIYTPILEDLENLEKSDGGDNLNLIYKILKRGDKFSSAIENKDFENLADLGLRYDLTLPLTRFYSGHKDKLPNPFKCIQVDQVFRAERPQKGRDREFIQCDIDILGSSSLNCEIELIDVTAQALLNIGLKNFNIRINNRKLLKTLLLSFGFEEKDINSICVTFDKLDKIGPEGVKEELISKEYKKNCVLNLYNFILNKPNSIEELEKFILSQSFLQNIEIENKDKIKDIIIEELNNLKYIINSVSCIADGKYNTLLDLSLVRGQGYYTGCVFEIESKDFSCSIGGGGRYDNLVGRFTGEDIPAVGFSIGFERIFSIFKEKCFKIKEEKPYIAIFYNKENYLDAFKYAKLNYQKMNFCLIEKSQKFGKQLSKIVNQNFDGYVDFEKNQEIKLFN